MLFWAKIFHFGTIAKYRKNRSNEIFWPKNALAKYLWNVWKNRSNEIRIRPGFPVNIIQVVGMVPRFCKAVRIIRIYIYMARQNLSTSDFTN